MTPSSSGSGAWIAATCTVLLALPLSAVVARATTVTVPGDFATIQEIVKSVYGYCTVDTIVVLPTVKPEQLTIHTWGCGIVLLGVPDSTGAFPRLGSLTVFESGAMRFEHLHFDGTIGSGIGNPTFYDCVIDSTVSSIGQSDPASLSLVSCTLNAHQSLSVTSYVFVDSCRFNNGQIALGSWADGTLNVRHCTFIGSGGGCAIAASTTWGSEVAGNSIHGYDTGVSMACDGDLASVSDNVIEDCRTGILALPTGLTKVTGNTIRRCGTGIRVSYADAVVDSNLITGCTADGISVTADLSVRIEGNVVAHSGAHGLLAQTGRDGDIQIINNTSYENAISGFTLDAVSSSYLAGLRLANNIAYANHKFGVLVDGPLVPVTLCNDWFGNDSSDVYGFVPAGSDRSVDPRFCDALHDDVHLSANSPLLNPAGCGLIGALGVGCGETPTLVQRFTAGRVSDGIRVVWEVAEGATASAIWVERAEGLSGQAWTEPVMERSSDGLAVIELDRSALPDRTYCYRLVARDGGNVTVLDPGIVVEARLAFGLAEVGPSPGGGPVRITFFLANAAAIEIDVFDVQGRRVASPARGEWPAGAQVVEWDGRSRNGQPAPAGLYLVRYRYPGGQDRRGIVRVQ